MFSIFQVALLHDTIEDTETTFDELQKEFGSRIAGTLFFHNSKREFICMYVIGLVMELTDDKDLAKAERKRLQVENAKKLSADAIVVRLADKIYNLRDLNRVTPAGWSEERVKEYFQWSAQIARQITGYNTQMDAILKDLFHQRNIQL